MCKEPKLYFAKVDVQSAFDTIPQSAIITLMNTIPRQSHYTIAKHVEVKNGDAVYSGKRLSTSKASRRWESLAIQSNSESTFRDRVEQQLALYKRNTVFVDGTMQKDYDTDALLSLMKSHIQQNLVKIGKKYYRQKNGIPQGSVLSSTLCNYFYADLETKHLSFLSDDGCLLLRLIDDFLLITTDRTKATRFIEVMHTGLPQYGVAVNPNKSLVNFTMSVNGCIVPRLAAHHSFPYCGTLIDCRTLQISKDRENVKDHGERDCHILELYPKLTGEQS
jgi:telomerase reverse transcriptase